VKLALTLLILLGALWIIFVAGLYLAMLQPPEKSRRIVAKLSTRARKFLAVKPLWLLARKGSLAIGDTAPDFELPALERDGTVRLSEEYRAKPVVLAFGSYT